jgi:hypothetical protein
MSDSELGVEGRDRLGLLNKFYIFISLAWPGVPLCYRCDMGNRISL